MIYNIPQNLKHVKFQKKVTISSRTDFSCFNFSKGYCFGLICVENGRFSLRQMLSCFKVISKILKSSKRVIYGIVKSNFFPSVSLTSKSIGVRMGKGKGGVNSWIFPVKKGRLLFELRKVSSYAAFISLRQAQYRLPFLTKIVFKNPKSLFRVSVLTKSK